MKTDLSSNLRIFKSNGRSCTENNVDPALFYIPSFCRPHFQCFSPSLCLHTVENMFFSCAKAGDCISRDVESSKLFLKFSRLSLIFYQNS